KLEKAIFKKYGGNKPAEDNEGGKQLEQGAESGQQKAEDPEAELVRELGNKLLKGIFGGK
ncbi:MAG: hypothetical protein DSZ32_03175, partial [Gammaproteobacteria bacterium]